MYSVGLFYAWDFLGWIIITIAYVYAPPSILREKNEYVAFFLKFFSLVFTLFLIVINVLANDEIAHMLFWLLVCPLLLVFHALYPFKKVQRSQHLSFFLFFISCFMMVLRGIIVVAFALSNM